MKKILIGLSTISVISILTVFSLLDVKVVNNENSGNSESKPEFPKERFKWMFEKYKDPATGKLPSHIRALELQFAEKRFGVSKKGKLNDVLHSDNKWSRRGPFEIGGRTRAFDFDIRNENILIAGGVSSGMWKSTDGGITWKKTSKPGQLHSVSCLAQDRRPGKENIWYYGTGEYWGNSASISGDGIYKSTDNGDSWFLLETTATNKPNSFDHGFDYVWNIVVDNSAALDKDIVYAATARSGIFRTSDGGKVWTNVLGGSSNASFADVAITSNGVLYASLSSNTTNQKGIFRSANGLNWINITPQNFPATYNRVVFGIAPSDENQVYIVGETPGSGKLTYNSRNDEMYHSFWKYTYLSGDGKGEGGKWDDRSQNLPKPEPTRGQMNSQSGYNLVLRVKPDNPNVVILGAVAVYRTEDGFATPAYNWMGGTCPDNTCDYDYRYTNHHSDVHSMFFSNANHNVFYTGSDGGVHKTIDCMAEKVEWISLNNGYFTTQFYTVAISHGPENSEKIIGGLQDNGTLLTRKDKIDEPWTNPLRADGFYCLIPDGGNFYYASQNATWQPKIKIFRVVHDENGTNTVQTRIEPAGAKDMIWNTPFLLDPNNNNIMYVAAGKMVWRNNDLSEIPFENTKDSTSLNWDSLSKTRIDFKEDVNPIGEVVTALGISTNPANVLYYGTNYGNIFRIDNANVGDPVPVKINGQNMPGGAYVSSFAVNPDDADKLLVSFSNYGVISIFYTEDGGDNWLPISGNLEENPNGTGVGPAVNWLEILKYDDKYVYFAGTSVGLFSTAFLNGPNTVWQMEGRDDIGNMVIDMLDARHSDKFVAVGTHGAGVYTAYYSGLPAPPSATQLVSPQNNTKNILEEVTLTWQPSSDAVFYEVELSPDPEFKNDVIKLEGITTTSAKYNLVEQGHKDYYWRVRTVNAGGVSSFTNSWKFTSAIGHPDLVYPANNENEIPVDVTLKWNVVNGATAYHVQVARGFSMTNKFLDTILTANELTLKNLESSKSHIWRVSSIEDNFEGIFSPTSRFVTKEVVSVSDKTLNEIMNINIYPNPVTDVGTIKLDIFNTNFTTLEIFNSNGILVKSEISKLLNPGTYFVSINTSGLSQGKYYIRVKHGLYYKNVSFQVVK